MNPRQARRRSAGLLLLAVVVVIWSLLPIVWLVTVAVLPVKDLASQPPVIDLTAVNLDKFNRLLNDAKFRSTLLNSLLIATGTMLSCLALAVLAAYSVARLRPPGRRLFLGVLLATQMVPGIVLIIPIFLLIRAAGLLDTVAAVVLVHTAFLLPYAIWILTAFFTEIPQSLERAAQMDGAGRLRTLISVILPISLPGLAATAIFVFIASWNDFFIALILTSNSAKTAPVRVAEISTTFSIEPPDVGLIAASAMLMVLPVLVVVALMNRYVVYGLSQGSLKT
jgi:ABC-type glycerol-3-phosphate transport system permease component